MTRPLTAQHKKRIRLALQGKQNALGFRHTQEAKKRISESHTGSGNPAWKGDSVGYGALHSWVRRRLPNSGFCSDCGQKKKRLDLANISQEYKREVGDWEWLCRKCHMRKDGRLSELEKFNQARRFQDAPCIVCGKVFHPKRSTATHCSKSCAATDYNLNHRDYSTRDKARKGT